MIPWHFFLIYRHVTKCLSHNNILLILTKTSGYNTNFFAFLYVMQTLLCASQVATWYWGSFENMCHYRQLWTELHKSENNRDCPMMARRTAWTLVGVAATVITTNWVVLTYMVFNTELLDFIQLPLTPESPYYIYCQIISICVALWQSGSWIMPIVTNYVITRTLTKSFQKLNKEIERGVSEGNRSGVAPGNVLTKAILIHQITKKCYKCF